MDIEQLVTLGDLVCVAGVIFNVYTKWSEYRKAELPYIIHFTRGFREESYLRGLNISSYYKLQENGDYKKFDLES